MGCIWEGNRWSYIALALCHRLKWFIHLGAQDLNKSDELHAYTPHMVWHSLPFLLSQGIVWLNCYSYILFILCNFHQAAASAFNQ